MKVFRTRLFLIVTLLTIAVFVYASNSFANSRKQTKKKLYFPVGACESNEIEVQTYDLVTNPEVCNTANWNLNQDECFVFSAFVPANTCQLYGFGAASLIRARCVLPRYPQIQPSPWVGPAVVDESISCGD